MTTCEQCKGRGFTLNPQTIHLESLPCTCLLDCKGCDGGGYVMTTDDRGYEYINHCQACAEPRRMARGLTMAKIPAKYRDCTIIGWKPATVEAHDTVKAPLINWSAAFEPGQPGMTLSGPVGTGKSHLMVGCLFKLISHGIRVRFVLTADAMQAIKDEFHIPERRGNTLRTLRTVPVLALDDVRAGMTEWEARILADVIQSRYQARTTTLITTNLTEGGLADALRERGTAVISRLHEMAPIVYVGGKDHRRER